MWVGVDGYRGGWVVVTIDGTAEVVLVDDLVPILARVRRDAGATMAIDMPIGLLDAAARRCDVEARALLGPRHSTVFPAPVRATLPAADYADACDRSRRVTGKAMSKQTYNLIGPIRQLDQLILPADGERIVEAHPELAFARLAGEPLPSKHEPTGRAARASALRSALPTDLDRLIAQAVAIGVPLVDLFDAAVLTITARHVSAGTEHRLGGEVDPTGKPAQVVY